MVAPVEPVAWTAIALLLGTLFGGYFFLGNKIDGLGTRIDGQAARIDGLSSRIDALDASLGARIDAQGRDIGARIDRLSIRLDEHIGRDAS